MTKRDYKLQESVVDLHNALETTILQLQSLDPLLRVSSSNPPKRSLTRLFAWFFSLGKHERDLRDAADKLQMSMRTTAKCRYNASVRLQQLAKFSFFTTTVLSLGLIFIPLMQAAEVHMALPDRVLNVIQIFLAVSVLVYSIVIATARYDVRATQLSDCGDKIKELIRAIDRERAANSSNVSVSSLREIQSAYSDVVTSVENHGRNDYRFARLEMIDDYFITGLARAVLNCQVRCIWAFSFVVPTLLVIIEIVFIVDILGITSVFTPYLQGARVPIN